MTEDEMRQVMAAVTRKMDHINSFKDEIPEPVVDALVAEMSTQIESMAKGEPRWRT